MSHKIRDFEAVVSLVRMRRIAGSRVVPVPGLASLKAITFDGKTLIFRADRAAAFFVDAFQFARFRARRSNLLPKGTTE